MGVLRKEPGKPPRSITAAKAGPSPVRSARFCLGCSARTVSELWTAACLRTSSQTPTTLPRPVTRIFPRSLMARMSQSDLCPYDVPRDAAVAANVFEISIFQLMDRERYVTGGFC